MVGRRTLEAEGFPKGQAGGLVGAFLGRSGAQVCGRALR